MTISRAGRRVLNEPLEHVEEPGIVGLVDMVLVPSPESLTRAFPRSHVRPRQPVLGGSSDGFARLLSSAMLFLSM